MDKPYVIDDRIKIQLWSGYTNVTETGDANIYNNELELYLSIYDCSEYSQPSTLSLTLNEDYSWRIQGNVSGVLGTFCYWVYYRNDDYELEYKIYINVDTPLPHAI